MRYTNTGTGNFLGANSVASMVFDTIGLLIKFTDNENTLASLSQSLTIVHFNDAPIIANPLAFNQSFNDSSSPQSTTNLSGVVSATDEETPQNLIYTIGGSQLYCIANRFWHFYH